MIRVEDKGEGVEFEVKVIPGSSRTAVAGEYDGRVRLTIAAPPEKGKANKALIKFLAETLALRKNDITIVKGSTSPLKRLRLRGISADELLQRLGPAARGSDAEEKRSDGKGLPPGRTSPKRLNALEEN